MHCLLHGRLSPEDLAGTESERGPTKAIKETVS
jgi:hypothetical protein